MGRKRKPIELKLDSPKIPAGKFKKGVDAFLGIIGDVTQDICGARNSIPWVIEVKPGCALIRAFADVDEELDQRPALVKKAIDQGLRVIDCGADHPEHFSENTLNKVKELSDLNDPQDLKVFIVTDFGKREVSPKSSANIQELFKWTVKDYGTLEGRLQVLAKQKGLEIRVRDIDSGRLIRCFIKDEILEAAMEAFDRRVSVTGLISYRNDGTPVNIQVDDFFRFPLERELPHHSDLVGILERSS